MLKATIARMSLLCALAPLGAACAEDPPIETPVDPIFPRQEIVHGKSYEEWAAAWWQWVFAIPADVNPNLDGPCDVNQPDPVFFLGANFGGTTTRSCAVPAGKAIFFPILNAYVSNCPENADESYTCEDATSEEYIHDNAESLLDLDNTLSLEIDGVAVELDEYRAHTATFTTSAPEDEEDRLEACSGPIRDNACGAPVGSPRNAASDGYWVMLRPLSPGAHQIRFAASVPKFSFSIDITYNLTVAN